MGADLPRFAHYFFYRNNFIMVHLLERHHNDRFTIHMHRFMPLWQHYRAELNQAPLGHETWEY